MSMQIINADKTHKFPKKISLIWCFILLFLSAPLQANEETHLPQDGAAAQEIDLEANHRLINDIQHWETQECELIDDIYMRSICIRKTQYRPHMNIFLTRSNGLSIPKGAIAEKQCLAFSDDFAKALCLYTSAAYYAKKDPSKANEMCQRLRQQTLTGECDFYIAVSRTMGLEQDAKQTIGQLMSFCEDIENANWRSECFFLLADEMAFRSSAATYLHEISSACTHSEFARDFGCFSHVAMILPHETREQFCRSIPQEKQPGCYWGIGASFLIESNDVGASIQKCGLIPEDSLQRFCLGGLSHYAGIDYLSIKDKGAASNLIDKCLSLPLDNRFKKQCILGLGSRWSFNRSTTVAVKNCLSVNIPYQRECFLGLSQGLLYKGDGFGAFLNDCSLFPENYQNACLRFALRTSILFNIQQNLDICTQFPNNFHKECVQEIVQFRTGQ